MLTYLSPDNREGQEQKDRTEIKNGYLVTEVLQTDGTPVSLATVMIYSEIRGELVMHKVLMTGINGKTEPVCFQIRNHGMLVCEGTPSDMPAMFTIRVEYSGYYTNIHKNAQVLPDTLAVQTSYMIPLAFGSKNAPGDEKISEASVRPAKKF